MRYSDLKTSKLTKKCMANYGIFNIRFQGPKVWNSLGKDIKSNPFGEFKKQLKNELMCQY